jgi:hypothetical protein
VKFKFSTTIVVQVTGEAEGQSDQLNVITPEKVKILPTFMVSGSDGDIEQLDQDTAKLVFAIIVNNVLNRAHKESAVPGVRSTGMAPMHPTDGERN